MRLGTIVITGIEPDDVCDGSIFSPANLAEGIGHPPDEIFAARLALLWITSRFSGRRALAAPHSRADADDGRKHPREVALVGKPGRDRNLGKRQIADGHQLLGSPDALAKKPLVRRQAGGDSKCT